MNSAQSKDDWVKAQQHKFHKPIDVDTLMWVRNRLTVSYTHLTLPTNREV